MNSSYQHEDRLASLAHSGSFRDKLCFIHELILKKFPAIHRMAVARYEYEKDLLSTYAYSCSDGSPLTQYSASLSDIPSLQEVLSMQRPRVINDMGRFADSNHTHSQILLKHGYLSSYTQAIICDGKFYGFLFYNAMEKDVFTEDVLEELDVLSHLLMLIVVNEWSGIEILKATLRSATHLTRHRDPETGGHLNRMSQYARMIARKLAEHFHIDDEYIEHLYLFSPLHDLGKIAIPDEILLKKGRLTEEEFETMKTHASMGADMVTELLNDYNLSKINYSGMLKNIAELHHEALDGSGYPHGLKGEQIPIEARIVAVADIFDALTSKRPYKEAMSNDAAFDIMRELSGVKLDESCVQALLDSESEIAEIQINCQDEAPQYL